MAFHFRRGWVSIAAAAFFALCCVQTHRLEAPHDRGFLPIHPPTPYLRYPAKTDTPGKVLVVHGLNSSKEFMQVFASALAEGGSEVYAIDLPGHGDSAVGFNAVAAQTAVSSALDYLGPNITVVGHSLGAGLLLDLATQRPFQTMVLLSPPPTPIDRIQVNRMLVVTGDWDMPRINAFIPSLEDQMGSKLEWRRLPWAGHSSVVFSPSHTADIVQWLGGDAADLKTGPRLMWIGLQVASSVVLGISLLRGAPIMPRRNSIKHIVLSYAGAAAGAVVVLKFVVVLSWLRLFAMDYLISFLFITGLFLCPLLVKEGRLHHKKKRGQRPTEPARTGWSVRENPAELSNLALRATPPFSGRGTGVAFLAAAFVILVMGQLSGSHFFHFTLSNGRWWRFLFIAAAAFPLFAIDELVLRPLYPRWKAAGLGLLTRILFGASVATGTLIFNRDDAFLVLVIHLVVLFWIGLWFATELVHRHTQNAYAAAFFAALIQGWAFAGLFVTV